MCSTPKPRRRAVATLRYEPMSVGALHRFADIANAADERRQQRQKDNGKQRVTVKVSPSVSWYDRLLKMC
jgi:hypothetical protein